MNGTLSGRVERLARSALAGSAGPVAIERISIGGRRSRTPVPFRSPLQHDEPVASGNRVRGGSSRLCVLQPLALGVYRDRKAIGGLRRGEQIVVILERLVCH
jgi:hypothetical protein